MANIALGDQKVRFFLNLQCRDGILDGTHPCTQEEAIQVL